MANEKGKKTKKTDRSTTLISKSLFSFIYIYFLHSVSKVEKFKRHGDAAMLGCEDDDGREVVMK